MYLPSSDMLTMQGSISREIRMRGTRQGMLKVMEAKVKILD